MAQLKVKDGHVVELTEPHDRPGSLSFLEGQRRYMHDQRLPAYVSIVGDRDGLVALRDCINRVLERERGEIKVRQHFVNVTVGLRQATSGFPLTVNVGCHSEKQEEK